MRSIKVMTAIIVIGMLSACDDSIVMDLVPDAEGYLWLAVNYIDNPDHPEDTYKNSSVSRYDLAKQEWGYGYETPFGQGKTSGMACDIGRAWVYGAEWDNYNHWYDYKIWEVGTEHDEAFGGGGD